MHSGPVSGCHQSLQGTAFLPSFLGHLFLEQALYSYLSILIQLGGLSAA